MNLHLFLRGKLKSGETILLNLTLVSSPFCKKFDGFHTNETTVKVYFVL